jgi:protein tyrosine/serine phosphatase
MGQSLPLFAVFFAFVLALTARESNVVVRPGTWAKPLEVKGVPNFHKVSDRLYRSGQPTAEGFRSLKALGIKTVVNLRSFNSDRSSLAPTDLEYHHIYMKAWHPEKKEIIEFLRVVTDESRGPVLVHCQHGADRTGTMCAIYRVAIQNWTKEDALKEMTEGGYEFHGVWRNLINWFGKLDIDAVKKSAGLVK